MKGKSIFYRWLGRIFWLVRCGCYHVYPVTATADSQKMRPSHR